MMSPAVHTVSTTSRWQTRARHAADVYCIAGHLSSTSCRALPDSFSPRDRQAHAGGMRQATSVLQWADNFGAAELMQRAEDFL